MARGLLNYILLVAVVGSPALAAAPSKSSAVDLRPRATFSKSSLEVVIPAESGAEHSFKVKLEGEPQSCSEPGAELCASWGEGGRLSVRRTAEGRHKVSLTGMGGFCFNISGQHLYGGPIKTVYPQEKTDITNQPYITADMTRFKMVQAVTERFWYTSSGLNLKVDPDAPLFLDQTREELCLLMNNSFPYSSDVPLKISYETCGSSQNLREAVACFFKSWEKPVPPEQVIGSPIWSTWVEFKRDITQDKILDFFDKIRSHDLRLSVMEVDDMWETCYGSRTFSQKFPDPAAMVERIHKEGYLVTLWVHPFIGPGCDDISPYEPYLVKYPNGTVGITEWWNGKGANLINFNDPNAVEWFEKKLLDIKKDYGFDSFKFDAGEASYMPGMSIDEKLVTLNRPNQYTTNYVRSASKFGTLAEVRVGAEAHEFPLMQRLQDTNSVWNATNWGLRSVIKSVLQLSLLGYGAILPDMIGGNCYGDTPDEELFIRWLQVNTFLPVIQFSLVPWTFGPEAMNLTRKFVNLHYEYKDRILKEFHDSSHPVINPIWWIAPEDKIAQDIDDQFLLGETLLVAPVVRKGAVSRDIYLPVGQWKDANTGKVYSGPTWLKNYPAPLEVLPYFDLVTE